jgi:hypothetical protein
MTFAAGPKPPGSHPKRELFAMRGRPSYVLDDTRTGSILSISMGNVAIRTSWQIWERRLVSESKSFCTIWDRGTTPGRNCLSSELKLH